jgi:type III secretion protein T
MGFLNRFAQQFNVFSLSMPIKAAAAIFMLILTLPILSQMIIAELTTRESVAKGMLKTTGTPASQKP